ncbi:hypothetical protein [Sphingomonas sp.]|jgi:hypothetical protein|uniref:hypothetical protein n=1 Tax=Sphingomonas sp. TaxID=28214 RepID=UPI002E381D81|nr:hypothetical protein [Sphingomonas sp.]HEX4693530.1 hypothetical protein [Sphingomonas sp.]
MTEDPRTTAARDHDDSDLIDAMIPDEDAVSGSAGGNLQRDIGSKADLIRAVDDPEAEVRPEKVDDIANDQAYDSDRRGDG